MGKIFAVAVVFRKHEATRTVDELSLHIVRDCETRGDAFLKVFDKEKNTRFQEAGCIMKSVLEIDLPSQPLTNQKDNDR